MRILAIITFIVLSCIHLNMANAAEKVTVHYFLGYEMGYGTFSFENKLDHKIVFPVVNLTLGAARKRFSYILNLSGSLTDAGVSEEEQTGSASRQDIDLTVAYQFNKQFSFFTGYKTGETQLTLINRDETLPGGGDESYQQYGLYIGSSYNWAYKNAGKLAVSIAYARLTANNNFLADGDYVIGEEYDFDDIDGQVIAISRGFSYTLSWTMPIKGNLLFRSRLKINAYQQDINYQGSSFPNVNESSSMLLVGLTSIF